MTRCDICNEPVSPVRAARYFDMGVDWALCPTCANPATEVAE